MDESICDNCKNQTIAICSIKAKILREEAEEQLKLIGGERK